MAEELLTQVDENDNVIGLIPRSEFDNGKLIHRSVYLLLFNLKGELLLLKRPSWKKWHPGLYSFSVTNSVGDETSEESMQRKIQNDFKQALPFHEVFKYHHFDNVDKAFKTVYETKIDKKLLHNIKGADNEYRWITLEKLKRELKNHPEKFAPPFIPGMNLYFKRTLNNK